MKTELELNKGDLTIKNFVFAIMEELDEDALDEILSSVAWSDILRDKLEQMFLKEYASKNFNPFICDMRNKLIFNSELPQAVKDHVERILDDIYRLEYHKNAWMDDFYKVYHCIMELRDEGTITTETFRYIFDGVPREYQHTTSKQTEAMKKHLEELDKLLSGNEEK